jgi:hypothetical protein
VVTGFGALSGAIAGDAETGAVKDAGAVCAMLPPHRAAEMATAERSVSKFFINS